jgi:hypothetical protein
MVGIGLFLRKVRRWCPATERRLRRRDFGAVGEGTTPFGCYDDGVLNANTPVGWEVNPRFDRDDIADGERSIAR